MNILSSKNIQLYKKALDVYEKQHEAIAKNIANANNPEFKKLKTDFSDVLESNMEGKMRTTDSRHIAQIAEPLRKSADNAGAKEPEIDVSVEMGDLAENQIRYQFVTRALAKTYQALNMSITGRNG